MIKDCMVPIMKSLLIFAMGAMCVMIDDDAHHDG